MIAKCRGFKGGTGTFRNPDFDGLSYAVVASVDYYHLVLFRASEQLFSATLAGALEQDIVFLAHALAVALGRKFVLQGNEFVQAAYLHLLADVVGEVLAGIGARALAVLEHEGRVVLAQAHQAQRYSQQEHDQK